MNIVYKKVSALIFSVIVTTSACGMEVENTTEVTEQKSPAVWYKKRSVHVAAAITTMAVAYAVAVYMNKIAVPATITGLFPAQQTTVQKTNLPISQEALVTNVQPNEIVNQMVDTNNIVAHTSVVEQCTGIAKNFLKEMVDLWKECKSSDSCFE